MWTNNPKKEHLWVRPRVFAAAVLAGIIALLALITPVSVGAQCTILTSNSCVTDNVVSADYEFQQVFGYWAVVGVLPSAGDDKDIRVYSGCSTSGSLLAASTGTSGMDFVIADFNTTPLGTYYPTVAFGAPVDFTVVHDGDPNLLSAGELAGGALGGTSGSCKYLQVWDVFLAAGVTYQFNLVNGGAADMRLSMFGNPGSGSYWAPRSSALWEISGTSNSFIFTPTTSDFYGLVLFANVRGQADSYTVDFEVLNDCVAMADSCQFLVGLPRDNTASVVWPHWTVFGVSPTGGDDKDIAVYTSCDGGGTLLATSAVFTGTDFVVGDFTSNALGDYHPRVFFGNPVGQYTLSWDNDPSVLTVGPPVDGSVGGMVGDCDLVVAHDVFLWAGVSYMFGLSSIGTPDVRASLFRNPGGSYWAPRSSSAFEMNMNTSMTYVTPTSGWYGLVIFNNDENTPGDYQIAVEELADCSVLVPGSCTPSSGWPRDYEFTQTDGYWAVVGVIPADGDDKDIAVFDACDGLGSVQGGSVGVLGADFVVMDFNHTTLGTYYPRVVFGDEQLTNVVEWDNGQDVIGIGVLVEGELGGSSSDCGAFEVWDVLLTVGVTYNFGFTRSGSADIRMGLFHNPFNGAFGAGRANSEFEMTDSGVMTYTAPATDWYGVVVFANHQGVVGGYSIVVQEDMVTGVDDDAAPLSFAGHQNTPNPFNPETVIPYDVPTEGAHVTIDVYDVNGRMVRRLVDGFKSQGRRTVRWDARDTAGNEVSSGVYFYRMQAAGFTVTRKMVLLR